MGKRRNAWVMVPEEGGMLAGIYMHGDPKGNICAQMPDGARLYNGILLDRGLHDVRMLFSYFFFFFSFFSLTDTG